MDSNVLKRLKRYLTNCKNCWKCCGLSTWNIHVMAWAVIRIKATMKIRYHLFVKFIISTKSGTGLQVFTLLQTVLALGCLHLPWWQTLHPPHSTGKHLWTVFLKWMDPLRGYSFPFLESDSCYNLCSVVVWHLNMIDCHIYISWGFLLSELSNSSDQ